MAITIVATAKASDANSYVTLADAEVYFEERLHSDEWDNASETDKIAALVLATELLDVAYNWEGYKVSTTQALRWPRSGVTTPDGESVSSSEIPSFLADATAEFALGLLTNDRLKDSPTQGFSQIKVGPIYMQISSNASRGNIVPTTVDFMLSHYGNVKTSGGERRLERC